MEDEVWGLEEIVKVLGYKNPRYVYELKEKHKHTEPIPMYFRTVGRGRSRKRMYWALADELRRWLKRIMPTEP